MKISRRLVLLILIAAMALFLGLVFWPLIVTNILQPISMVVWLLLRILVLSIHQKYFWYGIVFAALLVLLRFLPREQPSSRVDTSLEPNTTLNTIGYWRGLFIYDGQSIEDETSLIRELRYLLTTLYASKQGTLNNFGIQDALQQGRIPLPENIHAFLFHQEPQGIGGPLKKFAHSIRRTLRKWIRQWTGKEKTEHTQMIEEVLRFMETSLEINNDHEERFQNKH